MPHFEAALGGLQAQFGQSFQPFLDHGTALFIESHVHLAGQQLLTVAVEGHILDPFMHHAELDTPAEIVELKGIILAARQGDEGIGVVGARHAHLRFGDIQAHGRSRETGLRRIGANRPERVLPVGKEALQGPRKRGMGSRLGIVGLEAGRSVVAIEKVDLVAGTPEDGAIGLEHRLAGRRIALNRLECHQLGVFYLPHVAGKGTQEGRKGHSSISFKHTPKHFN